MPKKYDLFLTSVPPLPAAGKPVKPLGEQAIPVTVVVVTANGSGGSLNVFAKLPAIRDWVPAQNWFHDPDVGA